MTTTTYTAVCTREDKNWAVTFPELPNVATWAPNLRKAAVYARQAAAAWDEVAVDQIEIELVVAEAAEEILDAKSKRDAADTADAAATAATRRAVTRLAELGVPDSETASIFGLSHQRVHQIRSAAR